MSGALQVSKPSGDGVKPGTAGLKLNWKNLSLLLATYLHSRIPALFVICWPKDEQGSPSLVTGTTGATGVGLGFLTGLPQTSFPFFLIQKYL
jgi:hypothetical protein